MSNDFPTLDTDMELRIVLPQAKYSNASASSKFLQFFCLFSMVFHLLNACNYEVNDD